MNDLEGIESGVSLKGPKTYRQDTVEEEDNESLNGPEPGQEERMRRKRKRGRRRRRKKGTREARMTRQRVALGACL